MVQVISNMFNTTNSFMQGDILKAGVSLNIYFFLLMAFLAYRFKRQMLLIYIVQTTLYAKYIQISYMFYRDWNNRDETGDESLDLVARYFVFMVVVYAWQVIFFTCSWKQLLFGSAVCSAIQGVTIWNTVATETDRIKSYGWFVVIQLLTFWCMAVAKELQDVEFFLATNELMKESHKLH